MGSEGMTLKSLKGLLSASFGTFAYAVLQAVVLRVIAQSGGAEDVGLFLLAQAIATPVTLLSGLRLRDQLSTEAIPGGVGPYLFRLVSIGGPLGIVGALGWLVFANTATAIVGIGVLVANLSQSFIWAVQGAHTRRGAIREVNLLDVSLGVSALASAIWAYGLSLIHI